MTTRRGARALSGFGAASTVALSSLALTVPAQTPPAPLATVKIVDLTNLTLPAPGDPEGAYRGGPVELAVGLENLGPVAATVTLRVRRGTFAFSKALTVPPRTSVAAVPVRLVDPAGVAGCAPSVYTMTLDGEAADQRARVASVVPTCAWTGAVDDAWGGRAPDAAARKKAVIAAVEVAQPPSCAAPSRLKVALENRAPRAARSLAVEVRAGDDSRTVSAPIRLAPGARGSVTVQSRGGDTPPEPRLSLVDPSGAFTPDIANRGVAVRWRRLCHLSVTPVSP